MSIAVESIIKAAIRKQDEPLNIILVGSHERYETYLAQTGHNFYYINNKWNHSKALMPENLKEAFSVCYGLGYDLVICLGRNRGFAEAKKISTRYHLPLMLAELDFPNPNSDVIVESGDLNGFINYDQAIAWKGEKLPFEFINNCVDTNLFTLEDTEREPVILTAINTWKERDWSHGFRLYHRHMKDLPTKLVGQNKFLNWQELIEEYQKCDIYFNPTVHVGQPIQILEAMACGCIVVAVENDNARELVCNGLNGFLTKPDKIRETLQYVMALSPEEKRRIRMDAADFVGNYYSKEAFVGNWKHLIKAAANLPYRG